MQAEGADGEWKIQLQARLRDEIDAAIVRALQEMRRGLPKLQSGSGWQSEQRLHERPELQKLCGCVLSAAKGVLRFLRIGYDALEITGC